MSGMITGVNYGLLFSSGLSSTDITTSMLNTIFTSSTTAPSTATSTGNPLIDLKLAQANQATDVAKEAKIPQVSRAISLFTSALKNATTIKQALSNPDVMQVLLTANNLASYIKEPALAQKALLSDPSNPSSLVNQLNDSTLLNTAKSFNFFSKGLAALQNPTTIASLTNAYAEVMWRRSLDQATPGLSNALTFLTQASSIKKADDVLGDATNRAVVLTALGIPEQIAFQDLTAQEQAVSSRVNFANFQNPSYVKSLTSQYLLQMQQQAKANTGTGTNIFSLAVQASSLVV